MTGQDLPNSVDPHKAALWKAMGYPRWDLLPVVEKKERKPFPWKIVGWGVVGVIVWGMWWLA